MKFIKKTASVFIALCVILFIILIINTVSITLYLVLPNLPGSSGVSAMQNEFIYLIPMASESNKASYAYAAGISVAGGCIGAGYAIAHVGTSAISAITEKEESFGKAFLMVSLAEALAIYGLIMAILLWTKT